MQKFVAIIFCSIALNALAKAPTPDAGRNKSSTCQQCHGKDGNSNNQLWPKIAGQNYKYLLQQLKAIQQGEKGPRYEPSMLFSVIDLSDADLEDLASYFASQKPKLGKASSKNLALGKSIYHGGISNKKIAACSSCHGPKGEGNKLAGFPRLAGQHQQYTKLQLTKYKKLKRTTDLNAIMRDIAKKLSPEEVEAVSNYVQGLH